MSATGNNLQDEIRKIQRDTTLNPKEKSQKISKTMKEWNQQKAKEREKPKEAVHNCQAISCKHYNRGCDIQCPTCKKLYPCRICHDENEDHTLDRFKVDTVRCRVCRRLQGVGKNCKYCRSIFGFYYCDICHLW